MISIVRNWVRRLGFDLVRYPPLHSHSGRMKRLFDSYKINSVIDVGANQGQFGQSLRNMGFTGKIVSFEPLSSAYGELVSAASGDLNWKVASRMALGRTTDESIINVAANSESSSLLTMEDKHSDAAPTSKYVATERVSVNRLDDVAPDFLSKSDVLYLKIDTQGFEAEVLAGADKILASAVGVQLELSLAELYKGQAGYLDLIQTMTSRGFFLAEISPGFSDPHSGQLLQADAVFFKATA